MDESGWLTDLKKKLKIKNKLTRQGLAEFIGTFILVTIGDGAVAQHVIGSGTTGGYEAYGSFMLVNWAYGLAVAMGVWASGGVSGGHINPAVTLAFALICKTTWIQVGVYMCAQYLGAFLGASVVYGLYYEGLMKIDENKTTPDTSGIFATYPNDYIFEQNGIALADQVFSTAFLMFMILAITDDNNMKPSKGLIPLCVGLVVVVIGMAYGINCGYAINPARDFGPRLFVLAAGWGTESFSYSNYYFWVPIIGPHVGAIIGAYLYLLLIGIHAEDERLNDGEIVAGLQLTESKYKESA